ncbi:hypothetical protein C7999DRAFT_36293 [Corynascus novoguineensis]|uniref:FAD-binding domain-containing protein n=1 Tax=Corynascus novoguineensis TaxID=1126955 RepID=A0AAN7CJQ6_9PEZI|nr:hypothetical protein C7999DRAFT_36293 [Corynascus novoguineensis]
MAPVDNNRSFRIIVVGAGLTGLVTANCLQKLGIDHVVLEKGDIAPPKGGIAMWPHSIRILYQLGVLEELKKFSKPTIGFKGNRPDGRPVYDTQVYHCVEQNHGVSMWPVERTDILRILYENLADKSLVKTRVKITDIKQFPDRVEVLLEDGTVEIGDMIIGADGVHTTTRDYMWAHAAKVSPGLITAAERTSLKSHSETLVISTPPIPELGYRDIVITYQNRFNFLFTCTHDAVWAVVVFLFDEPLPWPHRKRYTEEHAEALAKLVMDKPITDQLVFADVWKRRREAPRVVMLQEGVLEHWHHGRICLVGDAAHKAHPNIALGGNTGIEDVARLMNHIWRAVEASPHKRPSGTALEAVFEAYQNEQKPRVKHIVRLSAMAARMHTFASPFHKLLANWVFPAFKDHWPADYIGQYFSSAPKLDFLSTEGFPTGKMPWLSDQKPASESDETGDE